jgi:hypothetical protein
MKTQTAEMLYSASLKNYETKEIFDIQFYKLDGAMKIVYMTESSGGRVTSIVNNFFDLAQAREFYGKNIKEHLVLNFKPITARFKSKLIKQPLIPVTERKSPAHIFMEI